MTRNSKRSSADGGSQAAGGNGGASGAGSAFSGGTGYFGGAAATANIGGHYDVLFGVVTGESIWRFSAHDIQNGFEGERRDKIIRTYVRNAYNYHLNEIFYTVSTLSKYHKYPRLTSPFAMPKVPDRNRVSRSESLQGKRGGCGLQSVT